MLRLTLTLFFLAATAHAQLHAAPKCTTTTGDFSVKQGGKTYNCKSKTTCTEYKCMEVGDQLRCGNVTTTSHGDCAEVQAFTPGRTDGVVSGTRPDVLDPGSPPSRRPNVVAPSGKVLQRQ